MPEILIAQAGVETDDGNTYTARELKEAAQEDPDHLRYDADTESLYASYEQETITNPS